MQVYRVFKLPAKKGPLEGAEAFRTALLEWFAREKKSYPWRQTNDPYFILVSEMMLQQTTRSAVLGKGYYARFVHAFPTIESLASAEENDVLVVWEGLGYYSRARNLQKTAQTVMREFGGVFPRAHSDILSLPGVGPYTAGAVLSFAFDDAQAVVDGNVARVLSRLMNFDDEIDKPASVKVLWKWAEELLSREHPRDYNSALMELGQTYCSKASPQCMLCPVNQFCLCSDPSKLPRKSPRRAATQVVEHVVYSRDSLGRVFLTQETGRRRKGLWKLPEWKEPVGEPIMTSNYVITRYKVTLHTHWATVRDEQEGRYFTEVELLDLPMPAPYRKVVEQLKSVSGQDS